MKAYPNYQDLARLEYGRMLWRHPKHRKRLLAHWLHPRHPYRRRFLARREILERLLGSEKADEKRLERELAAREMSLRTLIREIPPVFGSLWNCKRGKRQLPLK